MNAKVMYFDYLQDYAKYTEEITGCRADLQKKVDFCRSVGFDNPDVAAQEIRKIIESILRGMLHADDFEKLIDLIHDAEDEGLIGRQQYHWLNEIRRIGNMGSHDGSKPVKVADARNALECLDSFLRWLVINKGIDQTLPVEVSHEANDLFLTYPTTREGTSTERVREARVASAISGDSQIEKDARMATAAAAAVQVKVNKAAAELAELQASVARGTEAEETEEEKLEHQQTEDKESDASAAKRAFVEAESEFEELTEEVKSTRDDLAQIDVRIEKILNEHDYINKLLQGNKKSTDKQFEVMAFPRSANTKTNVLQVSGAAGTGKTLCLIAKLIMDVKSDQADKTEQPKTALFICFNKNLAAYVRDLIERYPDECGEIEVASFDSYVNRLVKYDNKSPFSKDVRYRNTMHIEYDTNRTYLRSAMEDVVAQHPRQASAYYLNTSSDEDVEWVMDEISWLEARYEDVNEARKLYLTAARTGRGGVHRPKSKQRQIILDVWERYNEVLLLNKRYTIGQAIKRLDKSSVLPCYDAIAVDEAQDFTLRSIQLLLRLRKTNDSRMYISGDEDQKIYQRDFTWSELDSNIHGYTITLADNKRNAPSIRAFSDRLRGIDCPASDTYQCAHIRKMESDDKVAELVSALRDCNPEKTISVVCLGEETRYWRSKLQGYGVWTNDARDGIVYPGVYMLGERNNKGLEFDIVVVVFAEGEGEDTPEEARLRYVHFTRARDELFVCYQEEVPPILARHYHDLVPTEPTVVTSDGHAKLAYEAESSEPDKLAAYSTTGLDIDEFIERFTAMHLDASAGVSSESADVSATGAEPELVQEDDEEDELVEFLKHGGVEPIDKRPMGGRLWVLNTPEFLRVKDELAKMGYPFYHVPNGGRATQYRDSWYTR